MTFVRSKPLGEMLLRHVLARKQAYTSIYRYSSSFPEGFRFGGRRDPESLIRTSSALGAVPAFPVHTRPMSTAKKVNGEEITEDYGDEDDDSDDDDDDEVLAAVLNTESEPTLPPNFDSIDEEALQGDKENYCQKTAVLMPNIADTSNTDNVIEKWHKQPGDVVQRNDVLCDISTPQFDFGMTTEDEFDAIMGEVLVSEGEKVPSNEPICYLYHQETPGKAKEHKEENE